MERMNENKSDGKEVDVRDQIDPQKLVEKQMKDVKHKIVVMSGKGGVGKTTVAVNLAFALASKGREVGILDADIHGPNVPKMLGIETAVPTASPGGGITPVMVPPNIKVMSIGFLAQGADVPIIWRGPLKMSAIRQFLSDVQWGPLDYLIIDLPPGTGDEPLSIAQLLPDVNGSIVVTTPQDVALLDSRKSVNFSIQVSMPVMGIIENMAGFKCPECGADIDLFKIGGGEKAANDLDVPFLGRVPIDVNLPISCDEGKPFLGTYADSDSAKALNEIVDKIMKRTEG